MEEFESAAKSAIVISILSIFLLIVLTVAYEHFKPKSDAWNAGYSDYPNESIYNEVRDNSSLIRTDEEADYMSGWETKESFVEKSNALAEQDNRTAVESKVQRLVTDRVNQSKKMEMK